jgi:hypothetical protein
MSIRRTLEAPLDVPTGLLVEGISFERPESPAAEAPSRVVLRVELRLPERADAIAFYGDGEPPDADCAAAPDRGRRRLVATVAAVLVVLVGLGLGVGGLRTGRSATPGAAATPSGWAGVSTTTGCDAVGASPSRCGSASNTPRSSSPLPAACQKLLTHAADALSLDASTWLRDVLDENASMGTPIDDIIYRQLTNALNSEAASNRGDLDLAASIRALDAAVLEAQVKPCSSEKGGK